MLEHIVMVAKNSILKNDKLQIKNELKLWHLSKNNIYWICGR